MNLKTLTNRVLHGQQTSREEAMFLYEQPLPALCESADNIRRHFCSNRFDICTIINAKSGRCSENCKFCAQSAYHHTCAAEYSLLPVEEIVARAKTNREQGILRYSIVTSGKRLSGTEVEQICQAVREIREKSGFPSVFLLVCWMHRIIGSSKAVGVTRVHNNLETSRRNFPVFVRPTHLKKR